MSKRSRLYAKTLRLLRFFPPSIEDLHHLSQKDRPGMRIAFSEEFSPNNNPLELGREAIKNQQYQQALQHFTDCLAKNAKNRWAWHGKGDAFQLLGDYKDAYIAYQEASQLDPQCALHLGGLSNALKGLGLIERSNTLKKQALQLDPSIKWMFQDSTSL